MVGGSCRFWFLTLKIYFPHNRISKPQPTTSYNLRNNGLLLRKTWVCCTQWKTCVCSKYSVLLRELQRLFCLPAIITWCTLHLCAKCKSDKMVRVLKFWVRRLVLAFSISHNLSGFVLIFIKGSSSIVWSLKTLEFQNSMKISANTSQFKRIYSTQRYGIIAVVIKYRVMLLNFTMRFN